MTGSSPGAGSWCSFGIWGLGAYQPGYRQPESAPLAEHDLVWIIDGAPTYWIDGAEVPAAAPCVLLLRPGQRMRIRWDPQLACRNAYIHFNANQPPGLLPADDAWPTCTRLPPDDVVRPLLRHLLGLLGAQPAGWAALAGSALAHVIGALCSGTLGGIALNASAPGPLVRCVTDLLASRWRPPARTLATPCLGQLAAAAGMSREGFCRAFRAEVGLPPLQALRMIRLERAAGLLCDGQVPVAAAAVACGFEDPFHFSRLFHRAFHCTPRDFPARFRAGRTGLLLPAPESFTALRCLLTTRLGWHP